MLVAVWGRRGRQVKGIVLSCDTDSDGASATWAPKSILPPFWPPQLHLGLNLQVNTAIHATFEEIQAFIDSNSPLSEGQVDRRVNGSEVKL